MFDIKCENGLMWPDITFSWSIMLFTHQSFWSPFFSYLSKWPKWIWLWCQPGISLTLCLDFQRCIFFPFLQDNTNPICLVHRPGKCQLSQQEVCNKPSLSYVLLPNNQQGDTMLQQSERTVPRWHWNFERSFHTPHINRSGC